MSRHCVSTPKPVPITEGVRSDELADYSTFVRDAEKNEPAQSIEHGTNGLGGLGALSRAFLELQAVGFTFRHQFS